MADVQIFRRVNGYKFEKAIAILQPVQAELAETALRMGVDAEATLRRHYHEGHSQITVTEGKKVDYFVNLDDSRGQQAAAAIESGTGRSLGIFALVGALARAAID